MKTQNSKSLVRPNTEANENRSFSVRQTLMQIKLDEKPFATRILRNQGKRFPLINMKPNIGDLY